MRDTNLTIKRHALALPTSFCHNTGGAGRLLACMLLVLALSGCLGRRNNLESFREELKEVPVEYAGLLEISRADSFTLCRVRSPWREGVFLASYVLVDKSLPLPSRLPEGTIIRTPVEKAVIYSSVHCALLTELGAEEVLKGVVDPEYIHLDYVQDGLKAGTIRDCGGSSAPLVERIALLDPEAILLSPYEDGSSGAPLRGLGIPLIQCADYMEVSALARAEWVRFYGLLLGKAREADLMFRQVAERYERLKSLAMATSSRPGVFCDLRTGSVWYQPGGESTMGGLFRDAGARYVLSEDTHSGSLPLSFEQVLSLADTASVWLLKYAAPSDLTYSGLAREAEGYMRFEAWRNKRIFGCNTSHVPFYEQEPFHPDLLLENLVGILHPELDVEGEVSFYTPLE